ncbi:MAG: YhbY family RNA-binding protein [Spirochaetales bacterium]|nr:YhbY family RNA-binding protein [Spirochaetales bacterium]
MELKGYQRSYLTKLSHEINPSVMLGTKGLTEPLIRQTEEVIEHHELIKVRFVDYKKSREELSLELAKAVDAQLVRVIGNIAILYRMARIPEHRKIRIPTNK